MNLNDHFIAMIGLIDWLWEILYHSYGLFVYSLFRHWITLIIFTLIILISVNKNSQKQRKPIFWVIVKNVLVLCMLTIFFFLPYWNAEKFHQLRNLGLRVNYCIEAYKETNNGIVPNNINDLKEICIESRTKEFLQYFEYESYTTENITNKYLINFYPPYLRHTYYFIGEGDKDFVQTD